jgi:peptidoglycan/LPS O-acetylase OafA/YrhL
MAEPALKIDVAPQSRAGDRTSRERTVGIDYLRTFVVLLVVIHHSVLAYVTFGRFDRAHYLWSTAPILDERRWAGFDLIVIFNDVFFMSLMFLVSGLFVWPSLERKAARTFMRDRLVRLGIPFAVVVASLMPLAFYPSYRMTGADIGFAAYWRQCLSWSGWPSGPAWFVWVLLAFDAAAAVVWKIAPGAGAALRERGTAILSSSLRSFAALAAASTVAYMPMLLIYGRWHWFALGPFAVQASRVGLYAAWFGAGVAAGAAGLDRGIFSPRGPLARRWLRWAIAAMAFFVLVVAMELRPPPLALYAAGFAAACAAMGLAMTALFLRFASARTPSLESLNACSYGIYLIHYPFVIWLQWAMLDADVTPILKAVFVFAAALALSWSAVAALRRITMVAKAI